YPSNPERGFKAIEIAGSFPTYRVFFMTAIGDVGASSCPLFGKKVKNLKYRQYNIGLYFREL
ncbi:hypothetical protein, partial [Microcoleus sp. herbarium13]|uniref:hypothetical protein n=1 Tax=Microcoleus sp. herbarium13 TaxID=3055438 RepID=UPI002FCE8AB5